MSQRPNLLLLLDYARKSNAVPGRELSLCLVKRGLSPTPIAISYCVSRLKIHSDVPVSPDS